LACHLQIDPDPDPAYHVDADPDADPDPTFQFVVGADPDVDPYPQHCPSTTHAILGHSGIKIGLSLGVNSVGFAFGGEQTTAKKCLLFCFYSMVFHHCVIFSCLSFVL
jgi:hypothetical protein